MKAIIKHKTGRIKNSLTLLAVLMAFVSGAAGSASVAADTTTSGGNTSSTTSTSSSAPAGFGTPSDIQNGSQCGSGDSAVKISIDIGCYGDGCKSQAASAYCKSCQSNNPVEGCNAIIDATFAIIRLITDGVGLVVIGSIVFAGIQYSTSRGDPGKTKEAVTRIRNTIIALLVYIFAYAILNYVLPAGFFAGG